MLLKTKIALAAALVAGTATVALAQDGHQYRNPARNGGWTQNQGAFQSAPAGLFENDNALGRSTIGRPEPQTFRYDSAPLVSGAGG